ncbi:MAG: GNAT family N-acetyltransferase [Acidimicrobiia bacterium]
MAIVVALRTRFAVDLAVLQELFRAAWGEPKAAYERVLERSLTYVGAFSVGALVGFVNVAWDGGVHAFLLDTTVHPAFQRRGIGTRLVRTAIDETSNRKVEWLHADFGEHLDGFYQSCGFDPTTAGLIRLLT